MKRLAILACLLAVACLAARRAHAQYVYALADVEFDSSCDCMYGSASFQSDYVAELYYNLTEFGEMYDAQNTFYESGAGPGGYPEFDFEADNVAYGDTFNVDANISGSLESQYGECATGSCGQVCTLNGSYGCSCTWATCPVGAPFNLFATNSDNANATCGEGSDLDTLMGEYSAAVDPPTPGCSDFYQAIGGSSYSVQGLTYNNSVIFSHGNIQDWGLFNSLLVSGVNFMNTELPSGAPSDMVVPIPLTSVYRTPVYNASVSGLSNEGHQHGIAFDLQSPQMSTATFTNYQEAEADWNNQAGWAQAAEEQQLGGAQPVCIEPGTYDTKQPPYYHLHVDWRPVAGMPLRPCDSSWSVPVPGWVPW